MTRRSTARVLAPLALAAAAIAVFLVIGSSGSGSKSASKSTGTTSSATRKAAPSGGSKSSAVARATPRKPSVKRRTYVVQAGDTLSKIATRTSISLATLQELNPSVDPQGLHAGQKLRTK